MISNNDELVELHTSKAIDVSEFPYMNKKIDKLSILNININSLNSNLMMLKLFLHQLKFTVDIIVITESKLDDTTTDLCNLDGYKKLHLNRDKHGGGIAVFYKNTLTIEKNETLTGLFESHESLSFDLITPKSGRVAFICIYRPPNRPFSQFINYMKNFDRRRARKKTILIGDFNICPLRDRNTNSYKDLEAQLMSMNFELVLKHPTFISHAGNMSLLDHLWCNIAAKSETFVFNTVLADHLPTITLLDVNSKMSDIQVKFRNFSLKNKNNCLNNIIFEINRLIKNLENITDIERRWEIIIETLNRICNKYFPFNTKKLSFKRFTMPWITSDIIKLINKKHKLFKDFKNKVITLESFKLYCKGLKRLLYILEMNYHKSNLEKTQYDMKKKWRYLNKMMGRINNEEYPNEMLVNNEPISNNLNISNAFGDFFKNIPHDIHDQIGDTPRDFTKEITRNRNSLFFSPITSSEIESITLNLKNSNNQFNLPTKFMKLIIPYISRLLADEFNMCINACYYPKILNSSIVRPIHKSGKRSDIANYRPISLIPTVGKILERAIYNRVSNFFLKNKLVAPEQFGFVKGRSTTHANIKVIKQGLAAVEGESFTLSVFIDFSKAFDCVKPELLMRKLSLYGVRGEQYSFLKAYLLSRTQRVQFRDTLSDKKSIDLGIPQGSVNGPLFYLIFCNDLVNALPGIEVTMYADDTVLSLTGTDINQLIDIMNEYLCILSNWCEHNKLMINAKKTKAIIFSNKKYNQIPELFIKNSKIEIVDNLTYLGLRIDKKMKFHIQIEYLTKKLACISGIVNKLSDKFDLQAAKMFYYSFVHSYLSFGIEIWGGNLMVYKYERLTGLWERIVVKLFGYHLTTKSIPQICAELKILDPRKIYKLNLMTMMYNIKHNEYFTDIVFYTRDNRYNFRFPEQYLVPVPKTNVLKAGYYYQMCNIWNELPVFLREANNEMNINNVSLFRNQLKQYLYTV